MMRYLFAFVLLAATCLEVPAAYEPNWQSLDQRPVPTWWTEAKFGIFVHWGPYAVPAYAPTDEGSVYECYAEWYQGRLREGRKNFVEHHAKHYGTTPYANFAADFKAENFDPAAWATLFKRAGAKYAVLTSKHHDGYALWPSAQSPYYNAVALGSGRDLAGEFTQAIKAAGLKSGFYYSLLEYANPNYSKDPKVLDVWARQINLPQMKDLVERYGADILWADGEWDGTDANFHSEEFIAWLYNESRMKDSIVVNDRWGKGCRGHHGGHYTTEYAFEGGDQMGLSAVHPWEECRGIGRSFGYNRFEGADDYMSREKCIETLVSIVSAGGNLLLNVGPTADGRIPPIMEDRLLAIGRWLNVNGEAIYGTTRWAQADAALKAKRIYTTQKGETLYLIVFGDPGETIVVPKAGDVTSVSLLGTNVAVDWRKTESGLSITRPSFAAGECPSESALVFKLVNDK